MQVAMASTSTTVGDGKSNIPNDGTGKLGEINCCSVAAQQLLTIKSGVVTLDPWLDPFKDSLRSRYAKAQSWIKTINDTEGGLEKFSRVRYP